MIDLRSMTVGIFCLFALSMGILTVFTYLDGYANVPEAYKDHIWRDLNLAEWKEIVVMRAIFVQALIFTVFSSSAAIILVFIWFVLPRLRKKPGIKISRS